MGEAKRRKVEERVVGVIQVIIMGGELGAAQVINASAPAVSRRRKSCTQCQVREKLLSIPRGVRP
jgi:hypothetical protein